MSRAILLTLIGCLIWQTASAISGTDYLSTPPDFQAAYVMGFLDGYSTALAVSVPARSLRPVEYDRCVAHRTTIKALWLQFNAFLAAHSDRLSQDAG